MSSTEQWLEHILASPVTEDDLRSGMKHRSLSEDAFLALMHHDLTFGGFGMPMAQQDPYLDVVALTAFQPYDNDVVDAATRGQAAMEDTVIILTPIYRIIYTIAVIAMRRACFEGAENATLETLLPFKPRHLLPSASILDKSPERRYTSLLEVAMSTWHRMCHAYVRSESKNVVTSLYCFAPNGERAQYVWINIDISALADTTADRPRKPWVQLVDTSYVQAVYDKHNIARPSGARTTAQLVESKKIKPCSIVIELAPGNVCKVTLPSGPGSKNEFQWIDGSSSREEPNLKFIRTFEAPFVEIVRGDSRDDYFLLITMDSHYSVFYRNRRRSQADEPELMVYPLLFHPVPEAAAQDPVYANLKERESFALVRSPRDFVP